MIILPQSFAAPLPPFPLSSTLSFGALQRALSYLSRAMHDPVPKVLHICAWTTLSLDVPLGLVTSLPSSPLGKKILPFPHFRLPPLAQEGQGPLFLWSPLMGNSFLDSKLSGLQPFAPSPTPAFFRHRDASPFSRGIFPHTPIVGEQRRPFFSSHRFLPPPLEKRFSSP